MNGERSLAAIVIRVYIIDAAENPVAGVVVTLLDHRISTDTWGSTTLTTGTAGRASFGISEGKYDYYYFTCEATGWSYVSPQYTVQAVNDNYVTFGAPSPSRETSVLSIIMDVVTPKVSGYLTSTRALFGFWLFPLLNMLFPGSMVIGLEGRWVDLYINGVNSEGNRTDSEGYYAFYPVLTGSYTLQTKFMGDMKYNACKSRVV